MLVKVNSFPSAKSSFKEAARISPKDAVPLSNLSAVEFELGNYVGCSLFSQKALHLLEGQEAESNEPMQQKIRLRLAKAYLHSLKLDDAASVVTKIDPSDARSAIELSLSQTQLSRKQFPDKNALRSLILDRVPRYRPAL